MNLKKGEHVFVECGADLDHPKYKFRRKQFMWPDQTDLFRAHYQNTGVYQTVMHYINPLWMEDQKGKYVINARESMKVGDFYLDFDQKIHTEEDYTNLRRDVAKAIRYLTIILSIDISQIQFYFSGNKGIHLIVDAAVIDMKPHLALNRIYHEIAKDIQKFCEYDTLDVGVYDDKRLFRMPNSINKKSGLYKIPLTYEEFKKLSFEEVLMLAQSPREIPRERIIPSPKAKQAFEKYAEAWSKRIEFTKEFEGNIKELKVLPPCIKAMNEKIFQETVDERNNSATALTSFYFQQGLEKEDTMQRMAKWGQENCQPALSQNEIETIVNSIYSSQYKYGCQTLKRVSGVCEKHICPLFNNEYNVAEHQEEI